MTDLNGRIPHALAVAYADLTKVLDTEIEKWGKSENSIFNPSEARQLIEQFFHEFCHLPGGLEELLSRCHVVSGQCETNSVYKQLMDAAFACFTKFQHPPMVVHEQSWFTLTFNNLVPVLEPRTQIELIEARERIASAERANLIPDHCRQQFTQWSEECKRIAGDAKHVETDGCIYILGIGRAGSPTADAHDGAISKCFECKIGVAWLQPVKDAADSLIAWAQNQPPPGVVMISGPVDQVRQALSSELNNLLGKGLQQPVNAEPAANPTSAETGVLRKAGRPKKSTTNGDGRAKLIAALTLHHRYAEGGCLNLEPVGNNELARLADVDRSTASVFFKNEFQGHDQYKSFCLDAGNLVTALKILNQEFSPYVLMCNSRHEIADND